ENLEAGESNSVAGSRLAARSTHPLRGNPAHIFTRSARAARLAIAGRPPGAFDGEGLRGGADIMHTHAPGTGPRGESTRGCGREVAFNGRACVAMQPAQHLCNHALAGGADEDREADGRE